MRIQNYWFGKVKALSKIAHKLIWCRERFLGRNWQPSWVLSPKVIKKQFSNNFIIFCTLMKHIFRDQVSASVMIKISGMEYPIFSFFFVATILKMPQERECIPVNITDFNSLGCKLAEKYKFVDLWEGCMKGLPRLQPTKLCIHDSPEIMFLGLFLRSFLSKFLTRITTPATRFWYEMKIRMKPYHLCQF